MKTNLGQKNPHEDDSVVSPILNKDVVIIDDEEKEAVDQPSKEPALISTIIIYGSANVGITLPKVAQETLQRADDDDDDDDDVDFSDLSTIDKILSASFEVPDKELPVVSSLEVQKFLGKPSSLVPTPTPLPSTQAPLIELPVNLLGSISTFLNNLLDFLTTDGEVKQSLIDSISSLSKAALHSSIQPLYQSLY